MGVNSSLLLSPVLTAINSQLTNLSFFSRLKLLRQVGSADRFVQSLSHRETLTDITKALTLKTLTEHAK